MQNEKFPHHRYKLHKLVHAKSQSMGGCASEYVLDTSSKGWQHETAGIVSNIFSNTLGCKALASMEGAKTVDLKYLNKTASHSLSLRSVLGRAVSHRLLAFT